MREGGGGGGSSHVENLTKIGNKNNFETRAKLSFEKLQPCRKFQIKFLFTDFVGENKPTVVINALTCRIWIRPVLVGTYPTSKTW